jgi:hypothetical protein
MANHTSSKEAIEMALTHQQLKESLSLLTDDEKTEVLRGTYESTVDGMRMAVEEWSLDDVLANGYEAVVEEVVEALYPVALEAVR